MARVDPATGEVVCKVVYFGPALSGKTTNIKIVHGKVPEPERGQLVSISSGQDFGMGATLYFLLTGHSPFEAESLESAIGRTMLGQYAELREVRDDVSIEVVELVGRCLMKDPSARPRDAAELIKALGAIR